MFTIETAAVIASTLSFSAGCEAAGAHVGVSLEWRSRSLPAALRNVAQGEVEAIWRRVGVSIRWVKAELVEVGTPLVSVSVIDDELVQPGAVTTTPYLGWIEFHGATPANVLRVSANAALTAARQARTLERGMLEQPLAAIRSVAARLLGRAIAHELGHYLLRSRRHTPGGLMRSVFPASEAMIPLLDRYRLEPQQLAALRPLAAQNPCR